MNILTVDFETYYSKTLGFKTHTTEEYIRHDDFHVIGVAVADGGKAPVWFSGSHDETRKFLSQFDWANSLVLAHNTQFDGAILAWKFGIKPKGWLDTLCMARALHGVDAGGSLKALAERYEVGVKGTEVDNALGLRRVDFTPEHLAKYGEYCCNDVALTYEIFNRMVTVFPQKELKVIDCTLRMFIEPTLVLNKPLLEQHLETVKAKKEALLQAAGADKDTLMSNDKFAELLKSIGVEPPKKISARTGKEAWAFAKTDEEFKALAEHPNLQVQALVSARLGTKTTLEETRTQRFIEISERGPLPVPIKYYAAHTGRWGGDDKINLQNLPSRGQNAGKLKQAIEAPDGYVLIDTDSSQIEARVVAWLAGQPDLVDAFAKGEDVYRIMASAIYNKPVDAVTKEERFVGKTTILGCFGPDTKVLTDSGWKRIVEVNVTDKVWDGESWVKHQGVIPKGKREVIHAWGIDATPEHEILTEHGWREWYEVVTNPTLFQSAFAKARSLSLIGNSTSNPWVNPQGGTPLFDVTADGRGRWTATTSKQDELQGATHALKGQQIGLVKSIGGMNQLFQTWSIGKDYLTALQASFQDAIQKHVKHIRTMVDGVLRCMSLGEIPALTSYSTLSPCLTGTTPHGTLTGSTTTKDTRRGISDLPLAVKMPATNGRSKICKRKLPTYDIAYAGPNNRYMIATDAGPLIVHNCGYGMGAVKFQAQLKVFGVDTPLEECQRIIDVYRTTYDRIPALWRQAQSCLEAILNNKASDFGKVKAVQFDARESGFLLPSGLWQRYEKLSRITDANGKSQFEYETRKGSVKIYGGKVVENICQAIARCVIAEQMLRINKKYRVVLTVHDAIACIAPEAEAKEAQAYVESCMRWRPDWAQDLPLNCESGVGKSYGDC